MPRLAWPNVAAGAGRQVADRSEGRLDHAVDQRPGGQRGRLARLLGLVAQQAGEAVANEPFLRAQAGFESAPDPLG